jgi:hypothetical protein
MLKKKMFWLVNCMQQQHLKCIASQLDPKYMIGTRNKRERDNKACLKEQDVDHSYGQLKHHGWSFSY